MAALLALGRSEAEAAGSTRGRTRGRGTSACLQHDLAYIAGSLGVQDTHSVTHNARSLTTRIQEADKSLSFDSNASTSNINSQLAVLPIYLKVELLASKLLFFLYEAEPNIAQVMVCVTAQYLNFICSICGRLVCLASGITTNLVFLSLLSCSPHVDRKLCSPFGSCKRPAPSPHSKQTVPSHLLPATPRRDSP